MATRWGIASVGLISKDFVLALSTLPASEHTVVAAAARDLTRAEEFAKEHEIPKAYGSYEELAQDPDVEVVYIGTINTEHCRLGKLFLQAGKHVLCEKPLCMNLREVKELIAEARSRNLFLMEAVWSRFNPVYAKLMEEIESGKIGEPYHVQADFGIKLEGKDRVTKRALGGSALLDIGGYCIQFALLILGKPTQVKAIGTSNSEGVDDSIQVIMEFPEGKAAVLSIHSKVVLSNEARVSGTEGHAILREPFWTPLVLTVNEENFQFTLPDAKKPFHYRNSAALRYEADEVRRCLLAGLKESPKMSLEESITIASIEDEIRRQVGIVFDQD